MRILDSKDPMDQAVVDARRTDQPPLQRRMLGAFAGLLQPLERAGVEHQVNKKLVRGLDYYTRTAFEVLSGDLGAQSAVAGGGRYDNLIEQFSGVHKPAVGFGVGLDRLVLLWKKPKLSALRAWMWR